MMRALRFSRRTEFACAPLLSLVLYGVMTVVYEKLGVFCDWVALAVPALIIGVAAFVVSQMLAARFGWRGVSSSLRVSFSSVFGDAGPTARPSLLGRLHRCRRDRRGRYAFANLEAPRLGSAGVRQHPSSGADSRVRVLGRVVAAVGHAVPATADAAVAARFAEGSGFYPSAWHWVASFMVSSLGVSVPLSVNAVDALLRGLCLPGQYVPSMRVMLAKRPGAVTLGALVAPAFTAFPWGFLIFGPLHRELGVVFDDARRGVSVHLPVRSRRFRVESRAHSSAVFAASVVAMALAQPNAVFTMGAMFIAFCVWKATGLAACIPWLEEKVLLG